MATRFIDGTPEFLIKLDTSLDAALALMAMDIERLAKTRVPVKQARLLSTGTHKHEGHLHYTVSFNTQYALYQEMGVRADGSHLVRNYTKAGTGAHYLGDAGKFVAGHAPEYFAATKAGVGGIF